MDEDDDLEYEEDDDGESVGEIIDNYLRDIIQPLLELYNENDLELGRLREWPEHEVHSVPVGMN